MVIIFDFELKYFPCISLKYILWKKLLYVALCFDSMTTICSLPLMILSQNLAIIQNFAVGKLMKNRNDVFKPSMTDD